MSCCFTIEFWNPSYKDYKYIQQKPKHKKEEKKMTVQYIKDTIKQVIEPEKKEESSNYSFFSGYLNIIRMFMTPEL